jgi:O-antigen/teichoic acid export membrane protein
LRAFTLSLGAFLSRLKRPRGPRRPGQTSAILRNAGWLLAGKGFGGILSLGYIALAARSLGVEGFGAFVMILAFGQGVAGIAQFQTAEVLIRFGAIHLGDRAPGRLGRVIGFCAMLDLLSAAVCIALALILGLLFGPLVGLSPADAKLATGFAISFLFVLRGTPVGILRLFDRFDLAALIESLVPAVRIAAAAVGYFAGPSIIGLLAAWSLAEAIATALVWMAAAREVRRKGGTDVRAEAVHWRQAPQENDGLWRFAWFTNLSSGVGFLRQQAGTLLVGWSAGAANAGGYRIAQQVAQAVSKPVVALSRAVYPDLAHVAASGGAAAVSGLTSRLSILGAVLGTVAVIVVAVAGETILTLIAGPQFASASPVFLVLTIAAAVELWAFGQEPSMLALGRAGQVLTIRAASVALTIGLMLALLPHFGGLGAASAVLVGNIVARLTMSVALARVTRSAGHPPSSAQAANALERDEG